MAPWHVTRVEPVGPLRLAVQFVDGTSGHAQLAPTALEGVFAPLRDPEMFAQVHVADGAVTWPGEIDLAPDAMHDAIAATGEYVLS